jgi:hypothetical protein
MADGSLYAPPSYVPLPGSMDKRLPPKPQAPADLSEAELQDFWTQYHGMPPPGRANQYGYDKSGKVYSRIEGAKKDTKAEEFKPIMDDVKDASFILAGKRDEAGNVVGGVSPIYRNLAENLGGWVGGDAEYQAINGIKHAVQAFGTMARGANHANKVDERNLEFFSPKPFDSQETVGFKADQLHRMMSAYIGATNDVERGRVFSTSMSRAMDEARQKYGDVFVNGGSPQAQPRQQVERQAAPVRQAVPMEPAPASAPVQKKRYKYNPATGELE